MTPTKPANCECAALTEGLLCKNCIVAIDSQVLEIKSRVVKTPCEFAFSDLPPINTEISDFELYFLERFHGEMYRAVCSLIDQKRGTKIRREVFESAKINVNEEAAAETKLSRKEKAEIKASATPKPAKRPQTKEEKALADLQKLGLGADFLKGLTGN